MDSIVNIQNFFSGLRGKRVAFVGIGVSHTDCIRLFARQGIALAVHDRRSRKELGAICGELEELGVRLCLGEGYLNHLDTDILFRTPGMYFHMPELKEFRARGGIVTSEMEVFFDLCPCPIIAVTGSDGKTTTTTLISEILQAQGHTVHLGGNIGRALLPLIAEIRPEDCAVVELSSFQLISMRRSPHVAVVTNVAPNHLDVHGAMEEYIGAKRNIYLHQNAFSRTVLGIDNEIAASFAPEVRGRLAAFSLSGPVENGAFLDEDGAIYAVRYGERRRVMRQDDIRIPGIHNVANFLAAICAVEGLAGDEAVLRVAREFGGVEHRIEFVREIDGVRWYNDSIATSPTRAIAGLRSFSQKIILIAGGYDKKIPYEPLAPEIIARVKLLILTGATAPKIEAAVKSCDGYAPGRPAILHAENLEDAVRAAREQAKNGDIVSLSPASASYDSYPNFEARGRYFKQLVMAL